MPRYEYFCSDCQHTYFIHHSMNERITTCPSCKSCKFEKLISVVNIVHGKTVNEKRSTDKSKREGDMTSELRENYGVEKFVPLRRGQGVQEVYNDVKGQGSLIKDQFQANQAISEKKNREKQKEWMVGALKRTPKKAKEMKEERAKEAATKRKIVL